MNNEYFKKIKEYVENKPNYMKFNNFKIEEVDTNYAKISVEINENSNNPTGFVHGGLLYTLADSTMGIAARTNGRNIVTINASINYLKPTTGKYIYATAKPIRVGNKVAVYECNIYNDKDELTSTSTGTYYFVDYEENNK